MVGCREKESLSGQARRARENAEQYVFQAEVNRLMDIIIHSLYSNKDIFLRVSGSWRPQGSLQGVQGSNWHAHGTSHVMPCSAITSTCTHLTRPMRKYYFD